MSTTTIRRRFKIGGILSNADSAVLSDPNGEYGVRRRDTGEVVVPAGTPMSNPSAGVYTYTFTDPASRLEYEFYVRFTDGGEEHYIQGSIVGGRDGNLYELIPSIAPYVGGCPVPVMKQKLRQTAKEFFERTGIWRENLDPISSVAGQAKYALDHGYNADIRRVREVTYDGIQWAYRVDLLEETVTLVPAPTKNNLPIVAGVTFLPRDSNDTYPDALLSRWEYGIVAGTLTALYGLIRAPYANADRYPLEDARYHRLIAEAKREVLTERGPANGRIAGRRFL